MTPMAYFLLPVTKIEIMISSMMPMKMMIPNSIINLRLLSMMQK